MREGKLAALWATKNKEDEWWSSFVSSPLAVGINWLVVDIKWISPNGLTCLSLVVALVASALVVLGGQSNFYAAAVLIQLALVLDCMDGQMAKYRARSSRFGSYLDKVTDQIQIFFWFGSLGYAAWLTSGDYRMLLLAFTGVSFYSLRVYVKYVTIFIETEHDPHFLKKSAGQAKTEAVAGLGFGFLANFRWFIREQRKFFLFNEAVFVFLLSVALVFDMAAEVLILFALSQVFYGLLRAWQRGRQIYLGQHAELLKPIEK